MVIYKNLEKIEPKIELIESKITNERQYWIKMFLDELNKCRTGKYKPLTAAFISSKMAESELKTKDLQGFYDECKGSANFYKYWWWSLKSEKGRQLKDRDKI